MKKVYTHLIKSLREDKEWNQKALADNTGLTINIIKQIESGRTSSQEHMESIAKALGVDVSKIFNPDFRVPKIITVGNNKGGAGKTSCVVNLAYELTQTYNKKRVLLIDTDGQMNTTDTIGFDVDYEKSIANIFLNRLPMEPYIQKSKYENLDVVISDYDMNEIGDILYSYNFKESILKKSLEGVLERGYYDYILFDTNPNLGIVLKNCFVVSDYLLIPVELTMYGIKGIHVIKKFFEKSKRELNEKMEILGIFYTKVDNRDSLNKEAEFVMENFVGEYIFDTYIPKDAQIPKSQFKHVPLRIYNKRARANSSFKSLAREVIENA